MRFGTGYDIIAVTIFYYNSVLQFFYRQVWYSNDIIAVTVLFKQIVTCFLKHQAWYGYVIGQAVAGILYPREPATQVV